MSRDNNFAKSVAIVGMTGTGKNFQLEKLILSKMQGKRKFIADVNNEYGIPFFGIDDFLYKLIETKKIKMPNGDTIENKKVIVRDSVIVFDEATIFFNSHKSEDVDFLLVGKRHQNNFLVFLFHSLSDFPPYIKRKIDFLILLKTKDSTPAVKNKFGDESEVYKSFLELKQNPDKFAMKIIKDI